MVDANQSKLRIIMGFRISTIIFLLLIFYLKSLQQPNHNASVMYMIIGAIMLILVQSNTEKYLLDDNNINRFKKGYKYIFIFTAVYISSISIIFLRDIFLIRIPNLVCLIAGFSAFISGISGVILVYRIKLRWQS